MMSHNRFQGLYKGQTAIAQRVYDVVPIAEEWTAVQINAEMARQGSHRDLHVTRGCLKNLLDAGLISEPKQGHFIRKPVRSKAQAPALPTPTDDDDVEEEVEAMIPVPEAKPKVTSESVSAIDRLASLSKRAAALSKEAGDLSKRASQLSSDIDAAALDIEADMQLLKADLEKFHSLRAVLKSIS